jgi:hypothetical protein
VQFNWRGTGVFFLLFPVPSVSSSSSSSVELFQLAVGLAALGERRENSIRATYFHFTPAATAAASLFLLLTTPTLVERKLKKMKKRTERVPVELFSFELLSSLAALDVEKILNSGRAPSPSPRSWRNLFFLEI